MESSVLQRVNAIISTIGMSITSLSKDFGIVQTTLNRQIKGDTQLSAYTIEAILHQYPDVSAEWLLRGEGQMEKVCNQSIGDISNSAAIGNNVNGSGNSISHNDAEGMIELQKGYQALLKKKDEQIDRLLSIIEKNNK